MKTHYLKTLNPMKSIFQFLLVAMILGLAEKAAAQCGYTPSFSYYQYNDSTIHIYSTSTGTDTATRYEWVIKNPHGGIRQTGTGNNIIVDTLNDGSYTVCLYLFHETALCDSTCGTITINSNPCTGLSAAWQTGLNSNDSVAFYASTNAQSNATYSWSFGDGGTSSLQNPSYVYSVNGTYIVCLITTYPGTTCRDTSCQSVTVSSARHTCN